MHKPHTMLPLSVLRVEGTPKLSPGTRTTLYGKASYVWAKRGGGLLGFSDVIRVIPMPGIFQDPTGGLRLLVAAERSANVDGRLDLVPSVLKADGSFDSALAGSPGTDAGPIEADMSLAVIRADRIATSVR